MAERKHTFPISPKQKSQILLITHTLSLSLLTLSIIFLLLSCLHTLNPHPTLRRGATPEIFLTRTRNQPKRREHPDNDDDTVRFDDGAQQVGRLDGLVFERESERLNGELFYLLSFPVRVYVYDMPVKFTFDLLWLFRNTFKETSNLTSNGSSVHRLIKQARIGVTSETMGP